MARRRDGARRASIAETALRIFGDLGFRSTTIKRIAARAGIAPGSIYTYFRDKEELFLATVEEGWKAFLGSLDLIAESGEPRERKVARLLDTSFGVLAKQLPLVRGIVFEAGRRNLLRGMLEDLCERVERLFAPDTRAGRVLPVPPVQRRVLLRAIVTGILFTAASAPPGRAAAAVRSLRIAVTGLVATRLGKEGHR